MWDISLQKSIAEAKTILSNNCSRPTRVYHLDLYNNTTNLCLCVRIRTVYQLRRYPISFPRLFHIYSIQLIINCFVNDLSFKYGSAVIFRVIKVSSYKSSDSSLYIKYWIHFHEVLNKDNNRKMWNPINHFNRYFINYLEMKHCKLLPVYY